ncbi:MAG TPA: NADH-quinone oxidoreductase subunit N, partial [Oscillatoriaceae cyanobacterium]
MLDVNWLAILPLLLVTGFALLTMLLTVFVKDATRVGYFAFASAVAIAVYTAYMWAASKGVSATTFAGAVTVDGFSYFFYLLFLMIAAVTILAAIPYLTRERAQHGEFYSLVLFCVVGMMVMVSSNDLMALFLGFETMSLCVYILTGWRRHVLKSNEAVLKYYFLGAFAAGVFLYGIALLYGTTATTSLVGIRTYIATTDVMAQPLLVFGALMVLAAIGFKIAAFPFHMWMPDVYEGAPAPVTGFMATAVKAAAFGLLTRVVIDVFGGNLHFLGLNVIWWLAILSMFVGNVFALVQQNLKRMLAYSSIAHTGYLLVGVCALPDPTAGSAILYYLVAYAFTNLGALACVAFLSSKDEARQNIADYAGAAYKHPLVGLGLAVSMFSLIGFPPSAGFFGKYYIFVAALKNGLGP